MSDVRFWHRNLPNEVDSPAGQTGTESANVEPKTICAEGHRGFLGPAAHEVATPSSM